MDPIDTRIPKARHLVEGVSGGIGSWSIPSIPSILLFQTRHNLVPEKPLANHAGRSGSP